jgi:hypothetical protein
VGEHCISLNILHRVIIYVLFQEDAIKRSMNRTARMYYASRQEAHLLERQGDDLEEEEKVEEAGLHGLSETNLASLRKFLPFFFTSLSHIDFVVDDTVGRGYIVDNPQIWKPVDMMTGREPAPC